MSRLLVSILGLINGVVAIVLILTGVAMGTTVLPNNPNAIAIGAIVGVGVAAIFCGGLAALLLIEKHLRIMADDLREHQRVEAWRVKQAKIAAKVEAKAAKAEAIPAFQLRWTAISHLRQCGRCCHRAHLWSQVEMPRYLGMGLPLSGTACISAFLSSREL